MHPFRTGALAAVSVLSLGVSLLASPLATAAPTPLVGLSLIHISEPTRPY